MSGRRIGELTFEQAAALRPGSILCLPLGSMEQHGPHLPLDTDTILAAALTRALVVRWGDQYDLWELPALPFSLSREHGWAAGTLSLSVRAMTELLRDVAVEVARSLPARRLLIVNAHGGNRGIIEALARELAADTGLDLCALHTGALAALVDPQGTDIHGGKDETSLMLAIAPERVQLDRLAGRGGEPDRDAIREFVLDPAVTWPWRSDDPRIGLSGVIGDPRGASVEHGRALLAQLVEAAGPVLRRLADGRISCG